MAEYSVFIQYDPIDKIFVACIPELPGCIAHGETKGKALQEIDIVKNMWIETAKELGNDIPEPSLYSVI